MTCRVVVTARARADALEAFVRLAGRSPDAAGRWSLALREAIEGLSTMPERHPVAEEESERLGVALRQMIYGKRRGVRHASRGPVEP